MKKDRSEKFDRTPGNGRRLLANILLVVALPPLVNSVLWLEIWRGSRAQAWDGTGHYALARIYEQSIFPDTFAWTHDYFAGIGFPNFYPPLFYFLIALVAHTHLFHLDAAFKIVLVLPVLLLPAMIWWLAYRLSEGARITATCASLSLLPLLIDERLTNSTGVIGLSYTSTFLLGLYTQPLGFVLLIAWFISYAFLLRPGQSRTVANKDRLRLRHKTYQIWRRVASSAVLLALALLANFFSSNVALLMIVSVVLWDIWRTIKDHPARNETRLFSRAALNRWHELIAHLMVPIIALGLIMFWLAPLISAYQYVVTRPMRITFNELVPPVMWGWYALAAIGSYLWLRRQRQGAHVPFLAMCGLLFCVILFGGLIAPRWFPFHANRLNSTLNFMLAVPVGDLFASGLRALGFGRQAKARSTPSSDGGLYLRTVITFGIVIVFVGLPALALIRTTASRWVYYDQSEWSRIAPVLQFGAEHKEGRYLVENLPFTDVDNAHDARAINAYLGAQGNEVLSLFFREAAPNVLFLNPLVDSLSSSKDTYGISSVLTDDTEYAKQPLAQHLAQARLFGTRYLVMHSELMKEKLASVSGIKRNDFDRWSVFDLGPGSQPAVSALSYKPALLVADLSFKERRQNDYDFVRFAEEQFMSGWYDVMLARSSETKLDRVSVPDGFGALIVATYEYNDDERAFETLKAFAQTRPLLLFSDPDALFQRIKTTASQFPQLEIIDRPQNGPDGWIESDRPTMTYSDSGPRKVWSQIRKSLEIKKTPISSVGVRGDVTSQEIKIVLDWQGQSGTASAQVPALINTSFHPNWRRDDDSAVYPVTPFLMLTFVKDPVRLVFARRTIDRSGVLISAITMLSLIGCVAWCYRGRLR